MISLDFDIVTILNGVKHFGIVFFVKLLYKVRQKLIFQFIEKKRLGENLI